MEGRRKGVPRSRRKRQGTLASGEVLESSNPLDSLFLHARWLAAGNEGELALYPCATHAFDALAMPQAEAADARIDQFLKRAVT